MTVRTTALIAGGLGLLLLIGGLIADQLRPETFGEPQASLSTEAVMVGPDVLATAPGGTLTVSADGAVVGYLGRTADADAWAATREVTVVTGLPSWESLSTERHVPSAQVGASPSPSPEASASASPSPEPSASPDPSASPEPSPEAAPVADIWRESWNADGTLSLEVLDIPEGLTVVVEAVEADALDSVAIRLDRVVNDGWITPLKWWGAVLSAVGLIALASLLFDMRGARARAENRRAKRRGSAPARPDGRRAQRDATATGGIPVVADTGEEAPVEDGVEHSDHAAAQDDAAQDDAAQDDAAEEAAAGEEAPDADASHAEEPEGDVIADESDTPAEADEENTTPGEPDGREEER